jgi:Family of unknown function (DUF5990)
VLIRIEGHDLPGRFFRDSRASPDELHNVHVAVQRRNKRDGLLGLTPGDATAANWTLECIVVTSGEGGGADIKGPDIQGPPGARFIYLSWVNVDDAGGFTLFRRAKLWLDAIPPAVAARAADAGVLIGRLRLSDSSANPLCAAVRPPLIEWSAPGAEPHCSS